MKRLVHVSPGSGERKVVATYWLQGDQVHVDVAPEMQLFFEPEIVVGGEVLGPKDGRKYFDSLERAYSASSFAIIELA